MHKVNQIKQLIEQGEAYQVVLSQRFALPTEADPFGAYRVLRSLNPSPYLFYINCGEYQLVGASPELLVKVTMTWWKLVQLPAPDLGENA